MANEPSSRNPPANEPPWRSPADNDQTCADREALVRSIRHWELLDQRVLDAILAVPRHLFVPERQRPVAYFDGPLDIGYRQTISQPTVVAMMTSALRPEPHHVVLEIGTGAGYQAAVLSKLVRRVESVEIVQPLAERAAAVLETLGCRNVRVHVSNGFDGLPSLAPFDGIIVTAAPESMPDRLLEQVADGARMVVPVGPQFGLQELLVMTRHGNSFDRHSVAPVRFVPMVRTWKRP